MAADPNDPNDELDALGRYLSKLSTLAIVRLLTGIAFLTALISLLLRLVTNPATSGDWLEGFLQNFSTELFGALITFIIIQQIVGGREQRQQTARQIEDEKQRLIRQLRTGINSETIRAAEELADRGWLRDGSLLGVNLAGAKLQQAILWDANLQETKLMDANLQGAKLAGANLQGSDLVDANLQGASMWKTNLQGANLARANLQGANLTITNLQGSDLVDANLQGVNLEAANLQNVAHLDVAHFDETTILPDLSKWTPGTVLARFTDPSRRDFWRSDSPDSPAYRGDPTT